MISDRLYLFLFCLFYQYQYVPMTRYMNHLGAQINRTCKIGFIEITYIYYNQSRRCKR